jgi:ATP-dependent helicase/nuclease subunit B
VDYKSSQKQLDPVLIAHGLQLQLLAYLSVLRHWPDPIEAFGVEGLIPTGVFFVNLKGRYGRENNRQAALADPTQSRKRAYRHVGRFDLRALRQLDARRDAQQGDQFNYRLRASGDVYHGSTDALTAAELLALLDVVEENLRNMGRQIFAGHARVAPYRKGTAAACDQCDYQAVCRIDPWEPGRFRWLTATDDQPDPE